MNDVVKGYSVIFQISGTYGYSHKGNYKSKLEAIGKALIVISENHNHDPKKIYSITPYREEHGNIGEVTLLERNPGDKEALWKEYCRVMILPYYELEKDE